MDRLKSLAKGIGGIKATTHYYDNWSSKYDQTLNKWNYTVPKKSIKLLKLKLKNHPKTILDIACGTGLFGEELFKIYNKSHIYGSDISQKSLMIAKNKKIYKNLDNLDFEKKKKYKFKYELVSMIGAMTYCKNFKKLFSNVEYYLQARGYFIFSHRVDLWNKQNFSHVLNNLNRSFKIIYISRPQNYLPLNKDFSNKIKIRLVLLQKC